MQNKIVLGVSVGESFAEFSLVQNPTGFKSMKILGQKRAYLPREGLKNSLLQFLTAHKDTPPQSLILSLRFLEKLLDYRLGGSVAQLVTEGFETWAQLRGPSSEQQALSSPELIFPVHERLNAQGQVVTALEISTLEEIAQKLSSADCKRVCVHFLHAEQNPVHEKQAASFFAELGFEVFVPEKTGHADEVNRWRKNTLNASVSGTFKEIKDNITEACQDLIAPENIHFLSGDGQLFQNDPSQRLSTIFAADSAMAEFTGVPSQDILYLGLEKFTLLSSQQSCPTWASPWGQVEAPHRFSSDLSIQPTSGLGLNAFQHLDFTARSEGWEPGPMSLGRGQRPTFLDLWSENSEVQKITGLQDRIVPVGQQRFKNTLLTLWKTCRLKNQDLKEVVAELRNLALQTLLAESLLRCQSEKLLVTGPLAVLFEKTVLGDHIQILAQDFVESRATAVAGCQAKGQLS